MSFSVLTFNMQNGQVWNEADPHKAEINLDETIAFLREQDSDIILLQEVERGYDGGHQEEPPPNYSRLREALTGYDSVFAYPLKNPLELPFGLGLAIFSRTPLQGFFRLDLPAADVGFEYDGERRKPSQRLLIGAGTVLEGREIRLLNTHLQAYFMLKLCGDDFSAQRDAVMGTLRGDALPVIAAGDFNCAPGEHLVQQFAKAGFQPSQNSVITWRRMPYVLDHIFFNALLKLEGCQVIPTLASDHHAVRSVFSFQP